MRKRFRVLNSNRNLKIVASLKGLPFFFSISFFLSFFWLLFPKRRSQKGGVEWRGQWEVVWTENGNLVKWFGSRLYAYMNSRTTTVWLLVLLYAVYTEEKTRVGVCFLFFNPNRAYYLKKDRTMFLDQWWPIYARIAAQPGWMSGSNRESRKCPLRSPAPGRR